MPSDDPESNVALARELLAESAAELAAWYPVEIGNDLEASAASYGERLVRVLGTPPALDVVLLGLGEDGHVASLFDSRQHAPSWTTVVYDAPKPPPARVSLTFECIAAARVVCVAALGEGKAEIVHRALVMHTATLPVVRALSRARESWLLLDPPAASLLPPEVREAVTRQASL